MPSSRVNEPTPSGWELEDLQLLSALGFGPNSALMNEPKLLIDSPFLTALQREFFDELGDEEAAKDAYQRAFAVCPEAPGVARVRGRDQRVDARLRFWNKELVSGPRGPVTGPGPLPPARPTVLS